jgi:hypothetical protein
MAQTEWYPISPDQDVNRRNMNLAVARQVIRTYGESAHMFALEQLLKDYREFHQRDWRQVLDIIDEINKGETNVRT